MFSDPEGPDQTPFEPYDIKYLIGTTLIAWAIAISIGLALRLS